MYRSVKEFQLTNKESKKDEENKVKNEETNNSENSPKLKDLHLKTERVTKYLLKELLHLQCGWERLYIKSHEFIKSLFMKIFCFGRQYGKLFKESKCGI